MAETSHARGAFGLSAMVTRRLGQSSAGDRVVLVGSGIGCNRTGAARRLTGDPIADRGEDHG